MSLKWKSLPIALVFLAVMITGLAVNCRAEDLMCAVCGKEIMGKYRPQVDHAVGGKVNVCKDCTELPRGCFACGLPVKTDFKTLADGRFLCARDTKEAVSSEADARQICETVRNEIDREFSRFITLPETNTLISIVDRFYLENLFKSPGYERSCVSVFGATQTRTLAPGRIMHTIYLLSDLRKARLMAVCAHEYGHAWLGENLKTVRKAALDKDTVEAFCELIASKYLELRGETLELQFVKESQYTKGQLAVLLAADSQFGFNNVLEWMKNGEDDKLEMAALDRVRVVKAGTPTAALRPTLLVVPQAAPTPVPDKLVLKGISGTPQNRFALINNATFVKLEQGKVRVGQTNVTVKCLEIRERSVVIEVNGSSERKELFLAGGL